MTTTHAITAWTDWMSDQGYETVELPQTCRTLAWGCGSVFSVLPKDGGESRVFSVVIQCYGDEMEATMWRGSGRPYWHGEAEH